MENLLLYMMKSATILSIFYLAYTFLLKNDTSFIKNRKFLFIGMITSVLLPSIYFTKTVYVNPANSSKGPEALADGLFTQQTSSWDIIGIIYLLITSYFIFRFLLQVFSIINLIRKSKTKKEGNYTLVLNSETTGPFSFFNYIFYNSKRHSQDELETILIHEKVHANQLHSLDILCANLITAILWFNPLSWFYKKNIEQNLEYLADKETAAVTNNITTYQHTLLKVCLGNQSNALVNHFHQSFIKKRIVMLNNTSSNRMSSFKMLLVAPIIFAFMLCFNVKTMAQINKDQPVDDRTAELMKDQGIKFVIKANFTAEDLENLKQEMKNTSDLTLFLEDIERNDQGLISNLNIKVKGRKNYYVSGNSNNEAGIPDLYFGHTEGGGMKIYSLPSE